MKSLCRCTHHVARVSAALLLAPTQPLNRPMQRVRTLHPADALGPLYCPPVLRRLLTADASFHPGPFNLGRWGRPVCYVACLWVAAITVIFSLPTVNPVTNPLQMNWTPIALACVLALVFAW